MSATVIITAAAVVIAALVVLLAATRRSMTGPVPGTAIPEESKYPSGYWLTVGIAAGVALGLLLGLLVKSLAGGISVGIGLGLIAGKLLDNRFDKNTTEYTEDQKQARLRRATWGLIVMILLVLGVLAAALLPLLD